MPDTWYLNVISFFGIFGLCAIAWLFSENKRIIPWRVIISGILLQLILGACVFQVPGTRDALDAFSRLLDSVFAAAEVGARFVFGAEIVPRVYGTNPTLGYIFAFRALPTVVFFAGLMGLLENLGILQFVTNIFAKLFYYTMRLSGAESLSGAANIFLGIEAAVVIRPYLAKVTRSEMCAILACCFGTAATSTLAIYVNFLKPVFPNVLGHLIAASIIAIPASFVLSKILVPETEVPLTAGGIPQEEKLKQKQVKEDLEDVDEDFDEDFEDDDDPKLETAAGEPVQRMSPMDAAILGALEGAKMAVSIAAVLILILGLVSLFNQFFAWLSGLPSPVGDVFKYVTLANIQGALFYPLTLLTGVPFNESWIASVLIGRRLLETAIPPYQSLAEAVKAGAVSDRTMLIVSYALSGFAHLASVGIFVGGTVALIPSRRKDITEMGWKALFVGTLATMTIACIAGVFYTGDRRVIGEIAAPATITTPAPSPGATASPTPAATPTAPASPSPGAIAPIVPTSPQRAIATPKPTTTASASPQRAIATPNPTATAPASPQPAGATPKATTSPTQQRKQATPTASPTPSPSP